MDSFENMIPGEMLDEKMDEIWRISLSIEGGQDESCPKLFVADMSGNKKDVIVAIGALPNNVREKQEIMRFLGLKLALNRTLMAASFFLLCEGWCSRTTEEQFKLNSERGITPSTDPDRQEVLMLCGASLDGRYGSKFAHIERHAGQERTFSVVNELCTSFFGEQEVQQMPHMLPSLVQAYIAGVAARSNPALRAQVEEIISGYNGYDMKEV